MAVKGLGEIALKVRDLDRMCAFYEHVVGLRPMARAFDLAFFEIAPGYRGHAQALVLFERRDAPPPPRG
ncbi:hypothetical protein EON82_11350 [bacterium]|nr:MAG: hypothetical protein EON82_11350 [bacterium]